MSTHFKYILNEQLRTIILERHQVFRILSPNISMWPWCGAFELWYWRRLLRVPWTARRSNQSILKEINPEYSLEGLMLKLDLQFFDHMKWRADSLVMTLMLEKIEGKRRRGWQRMRWFNSIIDSMDMNLSKVREIVTDRKAWHAAVYWFTKKVRHNLVNKNYNIKTDKLISWGRSHLLR